MFSETPTRFNVDLAGSWRYSTDGSEWYPVSVPSSYDWIGKVNFMRTFEIKAEMLDKYVFSLVVYGINYHSEISINGNFVGRHMGGYSSFVLQVPPNVLQVGGENVIKVSVDNELTPRTTLPLRQQVGGWRSYGGIIRDIYLLGTPRLFIEDPEVKIEIAKDGNSARLAVYANVTDRAVNSKSDAGVLMGFQTEVHDVASGDLAGRSGISTFTPQSSKSLRVSGEIVISTPKLWSPDSPDIYRVKFQVLKNPSKDATVVDEYDVEIGIRDLKWFGGHLYVNGTQTGLNGILWQEDHQGFGASLTYKAMEEDVKQIKNLGANLVRFLHPPHPFVVRLCDRYGLFALEEIPLIGAPGDVLARDYYQELASSYVREMVDRDAVHPSVLAWGIGDEFESASSTACEYANAMRSLIRRMDGRPVYFATHRVDDPCLSSSDLLALNTYTEDIKEFRDELKEWTSKHPEKPLLVVRYGKDVQPGNRNGHSDPLSLESQALHAKQIFEVMKESRIAGSVLWAFNDWRCDRPALTAHENDPYMKTMGLVAYDREKRISYDVARALFNDLKVQSLPVGTYASSAPIIYVVVGFVVLISFAFLYNSNRRFRDSVNRSLFRTYNFFADIRDQRLLTYLHSSLLAVIISVTWATIFSSIFSHYRDNIFLDNMLSQVLSDKVKETFVYLVWSPPRFILVVSAMICFVFVLLTLVVRMFSLVFRTHIYYYHAFSITMWSLLPYAIFIPVSMILYRLMDTEFYILPLFILMGLVSIVVVFRLLKGIAIIYDVYPAKVYVLGLLLIVICVAVLYGYYDHAQSASGNLKHLTLSIKSAL